MTQKPKPYRWLAEHYDEFFEPLRAPINIARGRLLRKILPQVESACDLACGAGATAMSLAKKGIRVYAVDFSPTMCRITREKAAAAGYPIKVQRGDMRTFRLPEPVDLITCECDALNHVSRRSDLAIVAKTVARALRPGGHFFFDVNNSLGFKRYWTGTFWAEKPGIVMVMNNGHNLDGNRAWSDIDWFVRDEGKNCWQRHQEHVQEVCWIEDEIRDVFKAAGFDEPECWDAAPFFKSDHRITPGCRSIYLVRKSGV